MWQRSQKETESQRARDILVAQAYCSALDDGCSRGCIHTHRAGNNMLVKLGDIVEWSTLPGRATAGEISK